MAASEFVRKMKNQRVNPDRLSALPQPLIGNILSLMPIRDAVRTAILSKKWQHCWRSMPKLKFTDDMIKVPPYFGLDSVKYKLANVIFHVLLLHNGPTILEFACCVGLLGMASECDLMISSLSRGNNVRSFIFCSKDQFRYKLPIPFFSLKELESIDVRNCAIIIPSAFNGFRRLRRLVFWNVEVSAKSLQHFLSNCPLLEKLILGGYYTDIDFVGCNKLTFFDLLQCVPLIELWAISKYYMKYLCAGCMPHVLPISLLRLRRVGLDVCMKEQREISAVLCLMRSSPILERIAFEMDDITKVPFTQTPINFLDPQNYPDLKLHHLEILEIKMFTKSPPVMEFVKLIMAKSHVLKKVVIKLYISGDDEVKMLRDMLRLPFPRASPFAELIIEGPYASPQS